MFFAQLVSLDCGTYLASRLAGMTTVGIPAASCKCVDIGKGLTDAFLGAEHSQLAHAGHVDQEPATLEHDQLAPRGGVTSLACVADRAGFERAAPDQTVDERGLAHS